MSFITSLPTPVGQGGGGIANALVGSLEVVAVASAMAIPIGIGAAIFLNEFRSGWLGWFVRFLADTLIGVPAIVVGLVAYAMVVEPMHEFSAISGSVAYAFIMIPIICCPARFWFPPPEVTQDFGRTTARQSASCLRPRAGRRSSSVIQLRALFARAATRMVAAAV